MDTQTNSETLLEKAEHEGEKIIHAAEHLADEIVHAAEHLLEHEHSHDGPTPTSDGTAQPDAPAGDAGEQPLPVEAPVAAAPPLDAQPSEPVTVAPSTPAEGAAPADPKPQPAQAGTASLTTTTDADTANPATHGLIDPQGNVDSVVEVGTGAEEAPQPFDPNAAPAPLAVTLGSAVPASGVV